MRYEEFKNIICDELRLNPTGLTWAQLKERLDLPYSTACPTWTRRIEEETGLRRAPANSGRAFVWKLPRNSKKRK